MVTAELAVAMPVVVAVVTLALSAITAVTDQLRCVDASRVGARLLARGEAMTRVRAEVARQAPDGADILIVMDRDHVRVEVSAGPPAVIGALGIDRRVRGVSHAVPEAVGR